MKFGSKHEFHLLDLIGDAVKDTIEGRIAIDWAIIARRLVKLAGLVLCVLAMVYVLYPTQRNGWILWLGEDKLALAHWTAVVLVGLTAVIVPLTRYAWQQGGGDRFLSIGGGLFAFALLTTVLMGTWNFYAYASSRAVATSIAATSGSSARIAEAERRLAQLDQQSGQTISRYDSELARTPASYATARSRILTAQTEARRAAATERASIQAELRAARAANVSVNTTVADPRPIDRFISDAFGTDRTATGVALDLWRSLVFELAALLGVSLATTAVGIAAVQPTRWLWGSRTPLGDDRAIPDLRAQPQIKRTPWALKERVFDAETGEEMVDVKGFKRRKGKKKPGAPQPATVEIPPIILPNETGVQLESDSRVARAIEDPLQPSQHESESAAVQERKIQQEQSDYQANEVADQIHDAPSPFDVAIVSPASEYGSGDAGGEDDNQDIQSEPSLFGEQEEGNQADAQPNEESRASEDEQAGKQQVGRFLGHDDLTEEELELLLAEEEKAA